MTKIHIPKSEETKRAEERRNRVKEIREKGQPQNSDIVQMLADVFDKLEEIEKKL